MPEGIQVFFQAANEAAALFWARDKRLINDEPYRIIPERVFLYDIFDEFTKVQEKKKVVIEKSAQMGVTELAINVSLWFVDNCGDVLYLLPTEGDASDFSAARLNPAIEESPYINAIFTDINNVGHKRAGKRNYYIRGTKSKSKLKSIPVDLIILDERDEMVQDNVPLALDRMDASEYKWEFHISTPTVPGYGIDSEFAESDQRFWFVDCKECGTEQKLSFFDNVKEVDGKHEYVCKECGAIIDTTNGRFKATNPDGKYPGYHLNQLMSPTVTAEELMEKYEDAKGDKSAMEDFYNSKLGLAYVAEGDKLEKEKVKEYIADYTGKPTAKNSNGDRLKRTMGVDVGSYLDYVISEKGDVGKRSVKVGRATSFKDIERLIKDWNVKCCVIDSKPETRKARTLAETIKGCEVFLCDYKDDYKSGIKFDKDKNWVTVDRTETLDASLGRFNQETISLPHDIPEEFAEHVSSLVRVTEEKKSTGQPVARYKNSGPDHLAHANNYDEIAFEYMKSRRMPGIRRVGN